ncbi:MAG: hypothetical protein LBS40_05805 [Burkholderiales bacterium]|nr:hypothetical protein [Burkholderiales bacterium]
MATSSDQAPAGRGGARAGAGRPKVLERARRINIMLDAATVADATIIGDGNISAGVRIAVKFFSKHQKKSKSTTS